MGAARREVASGLRFPEGPVWLADGTLLVVEVARGTLTRIDPATGSTEVVADLGGGPNGAAIGPDGAVYVCNNGGLAFSEVDGLLHPTGQAADYSGGRIERVDLTTGSVRVLYAECDGHPLRGPNDLVFDEAGNFWFTDHPKKRARDRDWGGLYYASPDGSMIREVRYRLDDPNGVGLSPDGSAVYVADTRPGRLWRWRLEAPGVIDPVEGGFMAQRAQGGECLLTLPGLQFFDSLAVEEDGRVVVATIAEPAGLTVVEPAARRHELVELPDPIPTNVCFGGPERRQAYATLSASGRLVELDWPRPGLELAFASPGPAAPRRG